MAIIVTRAVAATIQHLFDIEGFGHDFWLCCGATRERH
jgi:hypothetical protein